MTTQSTDPRGTRSSVGPNIAKVVFVLALLLGVGWGLKRMTAPSDVPASKTSVDQPAVPLAETPSGNVPAQPTTNVTPGTIDLMNGLDLGAALVAGKWVNKDGALISDLGRATRFDFGYAPPAEYDLEYTFSRLTGNDGIDFIVCGNGRQFIFTVAGWDNTVCGFAEIMAKTAEMNPTTTRQPQWLENGKRYTCLIKVRSDGVQALIDGQLVVEWKTDYQDTGLILRTMQRNDTIGISTWASSYAIYSAKVIEIAGHGKHTADDETLDAKPIAQCTYAVAGRNPVPYTIFSNGHIKNADGLDLWFRKGNEVCFQWGPFVDFCTLSEDGKTIIGSTAKGEAVIVKLTSGGF